MILQDLRRHLFRTLYYIYAVYERRQGVSETTAESVTYDQASQYWVAYDYEVTNGQFVLVDPFLVPGDYEKAVGMWTIDPDGNSVSSGSKIYRLEGSFSSWGSSGYRFTKYSNVSFASRPGAFVRNERTLETIYPVKGSYGNYWYELIGITDSDETVWYWEYTSSGVFVPHTSGIYIVTCTGGGGGGGGGGDGWWGSLVGEKIGGGGGSGYEGNTTQKSVMLSEGVSITVTVGKGGNGGAAGSDGGDGGNSMFGNLVNGAGGNGGNDGGDADRDSHGSAGFGGNNGTSGANGGTGGSPRGSSKYGKGGQGGNGGRGTSTSATGKTKGTAGSAGSPGRITIEFDSV